jgi:hypothetical protein
MFPLQCRCYYFCHTAHCFCSSVLCRTCGTDLVVRVMAALAATRHPSELTLVKSREGLLIGGTWPHGQMPLAPRVMICSTTLPLSPCSKVGVRHSYGHSNRCLDNAQLQGLADACTVAGAVIGLAELSTPQGSQRLMGPRTCMHEPWFVPGFSV